MKYFYTDCLAAAWMAKHFGMRFNIRCAMTHTAANDESRSSIIMEMCPLELSEIAPKGWLKSENIYYIHPDSLKLLQIRADEDILEYDDGKIERQSKYDAIGGRPKIIQRKGIVFMWPESAK